MRHKIKKEKKEKHKNKIKIYAIQPKTFLDCAQWRYIIPVKG
jgi:hypothetical protein